MAKTLFDGAERGTIFMMRPADLVVVTDKRSVLYDPRVELPLDEALVQSIKLRGVILPVSIRRGENGKAEVVDGRQRVRAAQEVAKRYKIDLRVPCVNRKGEENDLLGASIAANELRQNDTPLTKARKAARLINLGISEEQVAVDFGVTVGAVKKWLALLDAPADVREAIDTGKLSAHAAAAVAKQPAAERKAVLETAVATSVRKGGKTAARKGAAVKRLKVRSYREIQERLETKNIHPDYAKALRWVLHLD